jgi:hypothetical protein
MSFLATTSGVSGEDVRDLMLAAVEHRFGRVCYIAGDIRSFTRDLNHSMREALAMRMGTARSATPPPPAYAKNRRPVHACVRPFICRRLKVGEN